KRQSWPMDSDVRILEIRADEQQNNLGAFQVPVDLVLPLAARIDPAVMPFRHFAGAPQDAEMFLQMLAHIFIQVRVRVEQLDLSHGIGHRNPSARTAALRSWVSASIHRSASRQCERPPEFAIRKTHGTNRRYRFDRSGSHGPEPD